MSESHCTVAGHVLDVDCRPITRPYWARINRIDSLDVGDYLHEELFDRSFVKAIEGHGDIFRVEIDNSLPLREMVADIDTTLAMCVAHLATLAACRSCERAFTSGVYDASREDFRGTPAEPRSMGTIEGMCLCCAGTLGE